MNSIKNRQSRRSPIHAAIKITAQSSRFDRAMDLISRGVALAVAHEKAEAVRLKTLPAYKKEQKDLEGQDALDAKGAFFKAQKDPAIAAFSNEVLRLIHLRYNFREQAFEAGRVLRAAAQAEVMRRVMDVLPALKMAALHLGKQSNNTDFKAYAADVESLASMPAEDNPGVKTPHRAKSGGNIKPQPVPVL